MGVFSLGMFVPFVSSTAATVSLLISLIFTLWMGFGQNIARQMGTLDLSFSPMMNSTTKHCPESWVTTTAATATTTSLSPVAHSSFTHVPIYDVSYMWYAPISFLMCFIIGLLVSLAKPRDHKKLDKRLISPTTTSFYFWLPKKWKTRVLDYHSEVGSIHTSSRDNSNDVFGKNGSINSAYTTENISFQLNTCEASNSDY